MLYSDDLWDEYVEKVETNFKLKTYPHFDPYFYFPTQKREIHKLVSSSKGKKIAQHPFLPFVKILTKTPRYRYQESEEEYGLETKIRPISYASHYDGYIYGFYSFALNKRYQEYIKERGFDECVLAYRTDLNGKCNIQFAKEVFEDVRLRGECTAIALDIKGYFDNISHNILKEKWCKVIGKSELPIDQYKLFRSLTAYSYVNKNSILRHFNVDLKEKKKNGESWQSLLDLIPNEIAGESFNDKFSLLRSRDLIVKNKPKEVNGKLSNKGIPQGSSMSALLSNIYLIDFDEYLFNKSQEFDFTYRRYCDDLLIVCSSEKAADIEEMVINKIKEYQVEIQPAKTEMIDFKQDSKGKIRSFNRKKINADDIDELDSTNEEQYYKKLQYLGFEFDGQNIFIRSSSLSRYYRKMKGRIVKTVQMATSPNSKSDKIFKQQLFHRYTHLGERNFITYALNASKKYYKNSDGVKKEGMDSPSIRKQIAKHFEILEVELDKTYSQIARNKA